MPTLQETLDDLIVQLEEHRVIVNGAAGDANEARLTAYSAWQDVQLARVHLKSYTDERIQYVLDLLTGRLADAVADLIDQIGEAGDATRDGAVSDVNDGLSEWREWIDSNIQDILRDTAALEEWANDTFDAEIPRLLALQAELVEAAEQTEQWMLNEVGRGMQETEEVAARWRQMLDELQDTKARIINMDYSIYEMREQLVRGISVEFNDRLANFEERINVAAGEAGAVADRIQTLEVEQGEQRASVQTLERAMVTATEELATQITSLSVGTNTQFDPAQIWHFDANNEGWGGSWTNGFLRPGVSTNSPVISLDAGKYRQVRGRIRRVGNPTWNGSLTWTGATPAGPASIPEPVWTDGLGEFTLNLEWSGTLTRMTLRTTDAVTASDYFLVDWITVGRPAPGASSAQLDEERRVRIHEDGLLALRLTAIEGDYVTESGVSLLSEAIDGVIVDITDDETGLTALNNKITSLSQTLNDPNTGLAVTSSAISSLTNRVSLNEQGLETVNSDITLMKTDIANRVTTTAYSGLVQRVSDTETGISTINQSITSLGTTVSALPGSITVAQERAQNALDLAGTKGKVFVQNGAPPVAERLPQNLWIDTTAGANTPKRWNGSTWEAVTDKVARDAAAAAAAALAGLGSKADASAITGIYEKIDEVEETLTSEAGKITSLSASVTQVEREAVRLADVAVAQMFPKEIGDGKNWRHQLGGTPFAPNTGLPSPASFMTETGVDGYFLRIGASTSNFHVVSQAVIPVPPIGRTYRIRIRFRTIGGTSPVIRTLFSYLNETYGNTRNLGQIVLATTQGSVWQEFEARFTTPAPATGERWLRMGVYRAGAATPMRVTDIEWIDIDDITDLVAAEDAARAAAAVDEKVALKADASALESLIAKVGVVPNGTESLVTRITNLKGTVEGEITTNIGEVRDAASAAAQLAGSKGKVMVQATAPVAADRLPQNLWIDTNGNNNTPKRWNGTAWAAVTDKVATDAKAAADAAQRTANLKADASVVTSLSQRVGPLETGFETATRNIQTITNRLDNSTTGLSALSRAIDVVENDVKEINGDISAMSQRIQTVESTAGSATAQGLFRTQTAATPSGSQARIALQVRAGTSGTAAAWKNAAIFLEANSDGDSDVTVVANRFAIVSNGGTTAARTVPFFVKNNIVYMNTAVIENLSVGTLKIANNAITQQWTSNAFTMTFNLAYAAKVIIFVACQANHNLRSGSGPAPGSDGYEYPVGRMRTYVNGVLRDTTNASGGMLRMMIINLAAGNNTVNFVVDKSSGHGSVSGSDPKIAVFGAYK